MGRRDRERIERINKGLEMPRSCSRLTASSTLIVPERTGKVLVCHLCGRLVLPDKTREHISKCWGVTLNPGEPVPMIPTKAGVLRWISKRLKGAK